MNADGEPPLFLPDEPFPPYRFVPGKNPHPYKQEGGYAFGVEPPPPPFVPREAWRDNRAYLRGFDFYNRGWWWEAHEVWEGLWHVVRDKDPAQHDLLKGLIQLAAAELNAERGNARGAGKLRASARGCLERAREAAGSDRLCGLDLAALIDAPPRYLVPAER